MCVLRSNTQYVYVKHEHTCGRCTSMCTGFMRGNALPVSESIIHKAELSLKQSPNRWQQLFLAVYTFLLVYAL